MKVTALVAIIVAFVNSVSAFSTENATSDFIADDHAIELHGIASQTYFYERHLDTIEEQEIQAGATFGLDYSTRVGTSVASCFKNQGFSFLVPRGFLSLGRVDGNLAANVRDARAAGVKFVDTYFFPCPTCGNPAGQWNSLVNYVGANRLNVGMVWLDIEGAQYWLGNAIANRNFFERLLSAAVSSGWKIGIYSSKYTWDEIFGLGYTKGGNYPLWYAHYDNRATFSDFVRFGGFTRPTIKQYIGDTVRCGAGVDINFY